MNQSCGFLLTMAVPSIQRFESATIRLERGYSQLLKDFKESIPSLPTFEVCYLLCWWPTSARSAASSTCSSLLPGRDNFSESRKPTRNPCRPDATGRPSLYPPDTNSSICRSLYMISLILFKCPIKALPSHPFRTNSRQTSAAAPAGCCASAPQARRSPCCKACLLASSLGQARSSWRRQATASQLCCRPSLAKLMPVASLGAR